MAHLVCVCGHGCLQCVHVLLRWDIRLRAAVPMAMPLPVAIRLAIRSCMPVGRAGPKAVGPAPTTQAPKCHRVTSLRLGYSWALCKKLGAVLCILTDLELDYCYCHSARRKGAQVSAQQRATPAPMTQGAGLIPKSLPHSLCGITFARHNVACGQSHGGYVGSPVIRDDGA